MAEDPKTCQDFIILGRGEPGWPDKAGQANWTKDVQQRLPPDRVCQGQGPVWEPQYLM